VFETLRVYEGRLFYWEKHLERLSESCAVLGRNLPVPPRELKAWLEASIVESGLRNASLRLSVHWVPEEERLLLFLTSFESHPIDWYEKGVEIRSAVSRRPSPRAQDTQIKTSQYVSGVLAYLDSVGDEVSPSAARSPVAGRMRRPHELLFFGPTGTVAEGTVSNIFIVKRKCLLTPSVSSGTLRGVTRGIVMSLARKRGWQVSETHLTRHDLYTADECFLTNTSSEVLPVVRLDDRSIGDGSPGPFTRLLGEDFKKLR
jgi:branched-chain amino acid aminotransferase